MSWREELRRAVESVPADERPALAGELARFLAYAFHEPKRGPEVHMDPDTLLTATEVADRLRQSVNWVYANQQKLGACRLSAGSVRFPLRAVERFLLSTRVKG